MFNMHAIGGEVMLKTVMDKVKDECEKSKVKQPIILGVTVLTSMDRQQLNSVGVIKSVKNEVVHLAGICKKSGIDGVVCSGKEIKHGNCLLSGKFTENELKIFVSIVKNGELPTSFRIRK